jgi:uncharacterized protein (DUF1684 family)
MGVGRQLCAVIALCAWATEPVMADDAYQQEIERFRRQRESDLKAEDSWLTLAGLHWLRPGVTRVGRDASNDARLPEGTPSHVGTFTVAGDRVEFLAQPGVAVTRGGTPFTSGEVRSDHRGKADVLAIGDIRLIIIRRGERFAIRVKDNRSAVRANFTSLNWYPPDESWRIQARFEAATTPSHLVMDTIVGTKDDFESPGFAVFSRDGEEYRLQAAREGDKLWFVFRDETAGRTTAGNARQLYAELPAAEGRVILDFNKAVNLPCAYTPYATCPLAPLQNRLDFAITAGEKLYQPQPAGGSATPRTQR